MARKQKKRRALTACLVFGLLLALGAGGWYLREHGRALYVRLRFGIETVTSPLDANRNGRDDLTDLVLGAREYILTQPEYVDGYYAGGYPPEGEGVCTDVIWHAFFAAGYDLKALVDEDIRRATDAYPLSGQIDTNIDFRRVTNLLVFFERSGCQKLSCETGDWAEWQPGDIVIFEGHIALVSDRRNDEGRPDILHHAGYGAFEEDALDYKTIVGHYRWIPAEGTEWSFAR